MIMDSRFHAQVIPGIKDEAGELSMRRNQSSKLDRSSKETMSESAVEENNPRNKPGDRVNDEEIDEGGHRTGEDHDNSDFEASVKNLTFMGVPNSSIYGEARQPEHAGKPSSTDTNSQPNKTSKRNYQDSSWKRELGQAFKRFSKLTGGTKLQASELDVQPQVAVPPSINEHDVYVQNMASEFIDTMVAGCPAALFAGSIFLKDDNGITRAPLLLTMLSIRVLPLVERENLRHGDQRRMSLTSFSSSDHENNIQLEGQGYHTRYKLELEYGLGENRLKWFIIRSYKDLASLHGKLKLISFQQNTLNKLYIDNNRYSEMHLPHFPRFDESSKKQREIREKKTPKAQSNYGIENEYSTPRSSSQFSADRFQVKHLRNLIQEQDDRGKPMHLRIERYLKLLNVALSLRPQANRLFQFYEMSPIGTLLSYENGYNGKQGYMVIRSTASTQGWRVSHFKFNDFKAMIERHTTKWFLVRHSYITYVSDIYSTTPLDVFLVDSKFKITCSGHLFKDLDSNNFDLLDYDYKQKKISTKLLITVENSERKMQMIVKSEYMLKLWVKSIIEMSRSTIWSQNNRFDSFAPIRKNCFCKFLVDGRDYFWSLSEALRLAKDVIYIHDWWLSPELYMRRPVHGNQIHRIDRILKERAEQNVKIFIVVYRNVGSTVGTDSLWTKHSLLSLHSNIHVIRSPNQWLQNTYFWAHHEKFVVIDNTVAYVGGIDLCYGRYDTPDHVLHDEENDLENQIFPGKDYSNARVCDFYDLDKPFESMYDRSMVPRMPWHDIQMMTVGEAARDLSRHFVQRWNYLLRQKRPSRPTPLLTPASDFTKEELEYSHFFQDLKENSTCEIQVLRSAGNWSLGLKETENSIQKAYLKLIETSQHYIYIENQFFVTSSSWDGVVIENKIGDAIVDRIVKANSEGNVWKAFIVIPLMPGFNAEVDEAEGSSVRVIMQCQYQSISRGETSIFAKLKKLNIDPIQYIQFYSLRKWSTIGPDGKLVTEQLYVHAKTMIVDDRSCIIGSANINERSMSGNRDSEVAVIVRDTDFVNSEMNGKKYLAGRFPWELRQRLMREHLGCDVDLVEFIERKFEKLKQLAILNCETLNTIPEDEIKTKDNNSKIASAMVEVAYREIMKEDYSAAWLDKYKETTHDFGILKKLNSSVKDDIPEHTSTKNLENRAAPLPERKKYNSVYVVPKAAYHSFNYRAGEANEGIRDKKNISSDARLINNELHDKDVDGHGPDNWKNDNKGKKKRMFNDVTEQLRYWGKKILNNSPNKHSSEVFSNFLPDKSNVEQYLQSDEIEHFSKWNLLKRVCYLQYLSFKKEKNLYEVKKDGKVTMAKSDSRCSVLQDDQLDEDAVENMLKQVLPSLNSTGPKFSSVQYVDPYLFDDPLCDSFSQDILFAIALRNTVLFRMVFHCQPDNSVQTWREYKEFQRIYKEFDSNQDKLIQLERQRHGQGLAKIATSRNAMNILDTELNSDADSVTTTIEKGQTLGQISAGALDVQDRENNQILPENAINSEVEPGKDNPGNTPSPENLFKMKLASNLLYGAQERLFDRHTARKILERIHGHLVVFPVDWLSKEVESNNWFYNVDRLPPIDIYD